MPRTALNHFKEDIARARALIDHTQTLPTAEFAEQQLRSDILRSAWMFAVGALDAYFCDAYTDVIAATIISKNRQPDILLPDFFYDIRFPVRAILEPYANNDNWRWRMAARKMMERESILSLDTVRKFFNKFFRPGHKFYHDLLENWITSPDARKRLFGITDTAFRPLTGQLRHDAINAVWDQMKDRYRYVFQRRHDCIHNCDRPKAAPQPLHLSGTVLKVVEDTEFLVRMSDAHIDVEFHEFLRGLGCSPVTVTQAGY